MSPILVSGDAYPALARDIAQRTGIPLVEAEVAAFADGETRVRIEGALRGRHACIVQPTSTPTNERLVSLLLLADAARAEGAARVTALMPYFGYARQDVRKTGEARSAQLAARLLGAAGVDDAIVLELHTPALESAFPFPVTHLRADELFLDAIRRRSFTLVSPDAGGQKRAQRYALALRAPLAVVTKERTGDDVATPLHVLGEVRGRECLIVDDMASTGRTLAGAAQALYAAGARAAHAAFVHAVMAPGAIERIREAGVQDIVTTDSVGSVALPGVQVLSVAPLLAKAISEKVDS